MRDAELQQLKWSVCQNKRKEAKAFRTTSVQPIRNMHFKVSSTGNCKQAKQYFDALCNTNFHKKIVQGVVDYLSCHPSADNAIKTTVKIAAIFLICVLCVCVSMECLHLLRLIFSMEVNSFILNLGAAFIFVVICFGGSCLYAVLYFLQYSKVSIGGKQAKGYFNSLRSTNFCGKIIHGTVDYLSRHPSADDAIKTTVKLATIFIICVLCVCVSMECLHLSRLIFWLAINFYISALNLGAGLVFVVICFWGSFLYTVLNFLLYFKVSSAGKQATKRRSFHTLCSTNFHRKICQDAVDYLSIHLSADYAIKTTVKLAAIFLICVLCVCVSMECLHLLRLIYWMAINSFIPILNLGAGLVFVVICFGGSCLYAVLNFELYFTVSSAGNQVKRRSFHTLCSTNFHRKIFQGAVDYLSSHPSADIAIKTTVKIAAILVICALCVCVSMECLHLLKVISWMTINSVISALNLGTGLVFVVICFGGSSFYAVLNFLFSFSVRLFTGILVVFISHFITILWPLWKSLVCWWSVVVLIYLLRVWALQAKKNLSISKRNDMKNCPIPYCWQSKKSDSYLRRNFGPSDDVAIEKLYCDVRNLQVDMVLKDTYFHSK